MPDSRYRTYTWLMACAVVCYFLASFIPGPWSMLIFFGAFIAAPLAYGLVLAEDRQRRESIRRGGVELEAEIVGRYEAGAPQGSALAKSRQVLMSSEDPLELELRYPFDGREIVSRGRVSTKTWFHTRGLKTLKVKVSPERPEEWTEID